MSKINLCLVILLIYCTISFAEVSKADKEFLVGGDISMLTKIEQWGGEFRLNGEKVDPFLIFKNAGWNCCRLRLFVNPNGRGGVVNDLSYTIELAKRIKSHGMKLLLDLHYSDTWADPKKQYKPKAWEGLSFDELVKKVEDYTAEVIKSFKEAKVLPDMVQVGNEITPGFIWPDGKLYSSDGSHGGWDKFAILLKAGIKGVSKSLSKDEDIRIIIHIAEGGNWFRTEKFFDNLLARDVEFDIIGQSYYPWWHGTLADLKNNIARMAEKYHKEIFIVETAYPNRENVGRGEGTWSKDRLAWPFSPSGQQLFLAELSRIVKDTPDSLGKGIQYWHPESIRVSDHRTWYGGAMALFDKNGNPLPGISIVD